MKFERIRPIIIIALIVFSAEILIFNYKSVFSMFNKEIEISDLVLGDGISKEPGGNYRITGKNSWIEITDLDRHISNIFLDAQVRYIDNYKTHTNSDLYTVPVQIYADDEAHSDIFSLGERKILHNVQQSRHMVTHLSGRTQNIRLKFNNMEDTVFTIHKLSCNARIPIYISFMRIFVLFSVLIILYVLRPGSDAYSVIFNKEDLRQKKVKTSMFVIMAAIFFVIANTNPYFVNPRWEHHYQYQSLAESFADGQVSLKAEPSDELKAMENPYDTALRSSLGVSYKWDRAYYNGKYYVYFGVFPELVFYFPFYKLTGIHFSTHTGIYITGFLFILGVFFLMESFVTRWFRKMPFVIYLLTVWMTVMGSGALSIMMRPDFYSLPIIMAVALSVWGLGLWIKSGEKRPKKMLSVPMLAAGSTCMALVAACRPQLLIVSFVAVPLFFDDIFKKKILILGKKFANTAAFVLPYIIVAAGVMYYNFIRFGSPFDFGANYNLTTNDMTHRGMVAGRTFLGLFYFLFQTPQTTGVFPFIDSVSVKTGYLGTTITEWMYGGIIACNLWLLPLIMIFVNKKKLWKNKKIMLTFHAMLISAIIIVVADTQMAGILARYVSDFGWILFVAAGIMVFSVWEYLQKYGDNKYRKIFTWFMMIAFVQGICYNFLRIFATGTESIVESNPEFYYRVMHLIAFWT